MEGSSVSASSGEALDDALVQRVLTLTQHPRDLVAAASVCRQWQRASTAPALWVQLLGRDADHLHMPTLIACQGSLQRYAVTRWVWRHGKGGSQSQEPGGSVTPILIQDQDGPQQLVSLIPSLTAPPRQPSSQTGLHTRTADEQDNNSDDDSGSGGDSGSDAYDSDQDRRQQHAGNRAHGDASMRGGGSQQQGGGLAPSVVEHKVPPLIQELAPEPPRASSSFFSSPTSPNRYKAPEVDVTQPTWCPTGQRLAAIWLMRSRDTAARLTAVLAVTNLKGEPLLQMQLAGFVPFFLYWSPCGSYLAMLGNAVRTVGLAVVDVAAGLAPSPTATPRVTVVGTAAPLYICWAPHSPQLYIHGNGRHYATWDASAASFEPATPLTSPKSGAQLPGCFRLNLPASAFRGPPRWATFHRSPLTALSQAYQWYVDAWGQERLLVPLIGAVNPQAASTMSETCQLSSPRSPTNTSLPGNSSSRPAGAAPGAGAGVSTHQQQGLQAGSATAESVLARRLRLALEAATAAATASEAAGRQADRFSSGGGGTGAGASTSSSLYVTPAGSYGGAGEAPAAGSSGGGTLPADQSGGLMSHALSELLQPLPDPVALAAAGDPAGAGVDGGLMVDDDDDAEAVVEAVAHSRGMRLTHNLFSVDPSCPGNPAGARLVCSLPNDRLHTAVNCRGTHLAIITSGTLSVVDLTRPGSDPIRLFPLPADAHVSASMRVPSAASNIPDPSQSGNPPQAPDPAAAARAALHPNIQFGCGPLCEHPDLKLLATGAAEAAAWSRDGSKLLLLVMGSGAHMGPLRLVQAWVVLDFTAPNLSVLQGREAGSPAEALRETAEAEQLGEAWQSRLAGPQLQALPSRLVTCGRIMPTPLMARHYLPFAGQYHLSQKVWSPDSRAFCYACCSTLRADVLSPGRPQLEFGEQVFVQPLPSHPLQPCTAFSGSTTKPAGTTSDAARVSTGAAEPAAGSGVTKPGGTSSTGAGTEGSTFGGTSGGTSRSTAQAEVLHTVSLPPSCNDWGGGHLDSSTADGGGSSTGSTLQRDGQAGRRGATVLVQIAGPAVMQGTGVLAAWA